MRNLGGGGLDDINQAGLPGGEGSDPTLEVKVREILESLEHEAIGKGYFALIPKADQSFIDGISADQKSYYPDMSAEEVREMISRNWLGRARIFDAIATARGFRAVQELSDANPAEVAALTRSASYVFMDEKVFTPSGGTLNYFKIAGRHSNIADGNSSGVQVRGSIAIGRRLELSGAPISSTTSLQQLFIRHVDRTGGGKSILDVSAEVRDGTQMINEQTLRKVLDAARKNKELPG